MQPAPPILHLRNYLRAQKLLCKACAHIDIINQLRQFTDTQVYVVATHTPEKKNILNPLMPKSYYCTSI